MVLPEGFALPPAGYLVPLVVVLGTSIAVLWTLRPSVADELVVAVVPWMIAGGAAHAMYVTEVAPAVLEPLFGTPAVYLTLGATAGTTWVLAEVLASRRRGRSPAQYLFGVGAVAAIASVIGLLTWQPSTTVEPVWPVAGVLASIALTAVAWVALGRYAPATTALANWTGVVVLFGHVLDGVSTAIGIDVLAAGERSPLAELVLDVGSLLPWSSTIGTGWLFVLVKLALPMAVLVLFREYLEEAPSQARVLLAIIAAVGLGPGVHNTLLFLVSL